MDVLEGKLTISDKWLKFMKKEVSFVLAFIVFLALNA